MGYQYLKILKLYVEYIKAAELGHPHAQYYLGWMYDNGKGEENKN